MTTSFWSGIGEYLKDVGIGAYNIACGQDKRAADYRKLTALALPSLFSKAVFALELLREKGQEARENRTEENSEYDSRPFLALVPNDYRRALRQEERLYHSPPILALVQNDEGRPVYRLVV